MFGLSFRNVARGGGIARLVDIGAMVGGGGIQGGHIPYKRVGDKCSPGRTRKPNDSVVVFMTSVLIGSG